MSDTQPKSFLSKNVVFLGGPTFCLRPHTLARSMVWWPDGTTRSATLILQVKNLLWRRHQKKRGGPARCRVLRAGPTSAMPLHPRSHDSIRSNPCARQPFSHIEIIRHAGGLPSRNCCTGSAVDLLYSQIRECRLVANVENTPRDKDPSAARKVFPSRSAKSRAGLLHKRGLLR
jgi:hypothetical protein